VDPMEFLNEFNQLNEKRSKFAHKMILHKDFKELRKDIGELEKRRDGMPILLFFERV